MAKYRGITDARGRVPMNYGAHTILTVSADCCLIEDNPTYNSEGDNLLDVRGLNAQNRHSIVRFDFSSIAGRRVLHASLQMYCSAISTAYGTNRIQTHPMTENGIFVSAQVTWNIYATASNWSSAGGTYDTATAYKSVVPAPLAVGWWSGNVTPTAQRLVTQGSASGEILLRAVTENGADAMVRFSDSDVNPCELHLWTM